MRKSKRVDSPPLAMTTERESSVPDPSAVAVCVEVPLVVSPVLPMISVWADTAYHAHCPHCGSTITRADRIDGQAVIFTGRIGRGVKPVYIDAPKGGRVRYDMAMQEIHPGDCRVAHRETLSI